MYLEDFEILARGKMGKLADVTLGEIGDLIDSPFLWILFFCLGCIVGMNMGRLR